MKHILTTLILVFGLTAQANQLGLNIGATRGSIGIGGTLDGGTTTGSLGGHFYFQSEKTTAGVPGLISLAMHFKYNLVDQSRFAFDAYPGIGVHVFKSGGTDRATFGPSLRFRGTYQLSGGNEIGLDHIQVFNWLDENAPAEASVTALVFKVSI